MQKVKICAIISGGTFSVFDKIEKASFVIACDKGLEYAQKKGIAVDLLIGDFDSYTETIPSDIPRLELPKEKDDSDTMAAIRYAVNEKYDEIYLYCAFGGRFDHMWGNIQAASFAVSHGIPVTLYDRDNTVYMMSNSQITIRKEDSRSLSLLSITDKCQNVSASGVKYPLHDATLENIFPIGISNEWISDTAKIKVGKGIIAVITSKLEFE